MKGPRMIIATTTDQATEEDTEVSSRVTRSMFDNFMRRPSLEDQAILTIASMANNDLAMMRSIDSDQILCEAAFVFIDQSRYRFLISGQSAAWHFENGRIVHRSNAEKAPVIGAGVHYTARLEPIFELGQEKNAFLTASRTLAENLTDDDLEETLQASETPEEWMQHLVEKVGPQKQFCAITAFLPNEKPSIFKTLFHHV